MTRKQTPWFVLHSPEFGRAFESFYQVCNEDGVLDKKTKDVLNTQVQTARNEVGMVFNIRGILSRSGKPKECISLRIHQLSNMFPKTTAFGSSTIRYTLKDISIITKIG